MDKFMTLKIQALAEQDRWQEVLPDVTRVFHGIEKVSAGILKLW